MSKVLKTEDGIFIPREIIPDFDNVEVDASIPGVIVIRSRTGGRNLDNMLERIDLRRENIFRRQGLLQNSEALIREGRERELE